MVDALLCFGADHHDRRGRTACSGASSSVDGIVIHENPLPESRRAPPYLPADGKFPSPPFRLNNLCTLDSRAPTRLSSALSRKPARTLRANNA
jgi:hypothetical protein